MRNVGPGFPTFVIAEAGSNHGGSFKAAIALVDAAAAAGADAIKFQLWDADRMYVAGTREWESAQKWQLPAEWLPELKVKATKLSIELLCSAFDFDSLDTVDLLVRAHKIASLEADWVPYVNHVRAKGKPIFISLGGLDRRNAMLAYAQSLGAGDSIPMHCVVAYPCETRDVNLRSHLVGVGGVWGLSDHTKEPIAAPTAAVAMGACVIEKHLRLFTADELLNSQAPDVEHSIDPHQFTEMVKRIRLTETVMGSSDKEIQRSELANMRWRRGALGLRGA